MNEEEIDAKMQDFINKVEIILSTNIHLLQDNEILKINDIDEKTLVDFVSFSLEIKKLYYKEKEKNKELEQYKKYYQNERNLLDSYISKDKVKTFFEERLLKYTEADDGKYDKPYLTRGELELVDRYGECKEITELLLAEKIELPKECISKDKIKEKIEELNKKEQKELKGTKGQDRYFIKQLYQAQRTTLQELLED